MDSIRILHIHERPYGCFFTSPNLPGLTGGGDKTYAATRAHAESAAAFAAQCEAEERGEAAPDADSLDFVRLVPETGTSIISRPARWRRWARRHRRERSGR
jgi:hypothetical protein